MFDKAIKSVKKLAERTRIFCKAKQPEILLGGGLIGIGAGIAFTILGTLKSKDIYEDELDKEDEITEEILKDPTLEMTTQERQEEIGKEIIYSRIRSGLNIAVSYLPAIACSAGGFVAIIASHNVQAKRIAVLSAAYNTLLVTFNEYRRQVEHDHGAEYEAKTFREIENNKTKVLATLKDQYDMDDRDIAEALGIDPKSDASTVWWGEDTSYQWSKYSSDNITFLKNAQNYFNNKLHVNGYLMKSDVLETLGMDPSEYPMSFITGWIYDGTPGSDVVDIGINSPACSDHWEDPADSTWLLRFNDHGVILRYLELVPPSGFRSEIPLIRN